MKILSLIFPISLYLNIFQLEGYDTLRFIKWIVKNIFIREISQKRRLTVTLKIKLLTTLSFVIILIISLACYLISGSTFVFVFLVFVLSTQFYFPLILARATLYPFELIVIQRNIYKTGRKIKSLKNLKIIAITGSYGKTSVKEYLYQLIKEKYKTLRTPESYNTTLGISKVVDYELDDSYQYFICEMAAYHENDIGNLSNIIPPHYGILTGITTQHLERFGNLLKIIKTKFELYDAIESKNNFIFNLNDTNILNEIKARKIKNASGYLKYSNIKLTKEGSDFDLFYKQTKYKIHTSIFGTSNIENLTGAISMALMVGLEIKYLINKAKDLVPVESRFSLTHQNQSTIVNNTFSSNEQSFTEMLKNVKQVEGTKVLVTPGLVELGKMERITNSEMGKLSKGIFDKIILVGNNDRTKAFAKCLDNPPVFIPDTRKDYFAKIEELSKKYNWIFLENDITENY